MKEYKVLVEVYSNRLQDNLNSAAADGWTLKAIWESQISDAANYIAIMEREVRNAND